MQSRRRKEGALGRLWAELEEKALRMRRNPTSAEDRLWQELRGGRLDGLRFRRQHVLGRFIVDFYAVNAGIVIEVDGPIHAGQEDSDAERDVYLRSLGLTALRFSNDEVLQNTQHVIDAIHVAAVKNL